MCVGFAELAISTAAVAVRRIQSCFRARQARRQVAASNRVEESVGKETQTVEVAHVHGKQHSIC